MKLTFALRITAAILILACALQFLFFEQLLIKMIIVAHILFALSLFSDKHSRRIAVISIGLAIVVPIGAWRMIERGDATFEFFITNIVIFIFIAYTAIKTLTEQ